MLAPVPVAPNTGAAPFTNFSYALQWLTFGAIALFALVYFVRLELLQRPSGRPPNGRRRRALAGDDDRASSRSAAGSPRPRRAEATGWDDPGPVGRGSSCDGQ